jgi:hypothetical protein
MMNGNDDILQPDPAPIAAFQAEYSKLARYREERMATLKSAVFDALAAAALTIVTVTFNGYGDSGQIETIEAKIGEESAALPSAAAHIHIPAEGPVDSGFEHADLSIRDAIEELAFDFLSATHSGWENNEGADGDFTFDVAERTITLDYNEHYIETEHSRHIF